ncbi:hypothetical protein QWJ90_05360 [Microbacterium oryzae]|uniref:hypothetical protein n=1 Tax=Microbacterium oryzae TaxID=743009 RepID=UPI0025AF0BAB|nr:hypothetical protein [Microbacterium oryzae]MDN3310348.1 hypothetical protein [Microbacterium oryzae]
MPAGVDTPDEAPHMRRLASAMKDTGRRNVVLAAAAVPVHVTVAGSKTLVLLGHFSTFIAANVLFTLGMAAVKILVVRAHRSEEGGHGTEAALRTYRISGILLTSMAAVYTVACIPLALGEQVRVGYDRYVAIALAVIALVELGLAIHGFFSARRLGDVLMRAVKLGNMAAALVLLVLAQTALLSILGPWQDPSRYNGWCGVVLGGVALAIGTSMIRHRPGE